MERSTSNTCECLPLSEQSVEAGKHERAAALLEGCLRGHGGGTAVQTRLAELYLETGRRDDAIGQLLRVQEALADQGDSSGAIAVASRIVGMRSIC